jgi:sterol 3beta-glucosyltransferase
LFDACRPSDEPGVLDCPGSGKGPIFGGLVVRIAMVANGSRGDAQPLLVLGDQLRRRGHQVVLGVSPNLVTFGEKAGLTTYPVGPDSQQFLESAEGRQWLANGNATALTQALGKVVRDNAAQFNADTLRVCDGADLIVAGSLAEHRAACIAQARDVPLVCLHYAPMRPTGAYPNLLITTARLPRRRNLATHSRFQRLYWRSMAADINNFRANLGLPPVHTPTAIRLAAARTLELQAYHRALVPDLTDYPAHRPLVGFLTSDEDLRRRLGELDVDPALDAWLTTDDPPVFVGFGSMPILDPAAALTMITATAQRLGVRILIGAGWSRFDPPPGATERVRVAAGVLNYDRILPRCRAAVHHGGSGTVAAGVAAGIPTFVCSLVADNPFWGARVEQLGIGVHERFADLTPDRFEAGLRRALHPRVITRARETGMALRADTDVAARAAELITGQQTCPVKPHPR